MATPDYLPSFMEEFKFRHQGLETLPPAHRTNKSFLPFADEASTTYAWRASRRGQGGKIGHVRSGLVAAPRCPPIDYDGEEDTSVRYRCRARLARGGRIVFDRVPIAPGLPAPLTLAVGEGVEGGAAAAASEEENPAAVDSTRMSLGSSVLLSAGTKIPHLDKYPTVDLVAGSLFQYPKRYREISQLLDDNEEEVLEINPAAPSDPDSFLALPPRPKPPETDAVVTLRFALPV